MGEVNESDQFLNNNAKNKFEREVVYVKEKRSCGAQVSDTIFKRVFILSWIRKYDGDCFIADLIAGITLGLTMIPQSIAYAALAGLDSHYGLYAAFMGSYIYVIFGSVKQVSIGPTSLMALLILPATYGKPIEYVFFLTFVAGCIELLLGVLKLGFITDFIPLPVTSAFTSATALVICVSQLKSITGISYLGTNFSSYIIGFFKNVSAVKSGDVILGLSCITALLLLRKVQEIPVSETNPNQRIIKKILWYITISRNALVVFISSALSYYLTNGGELTSPYKLSGKVTSGIPELKIPDFSVHNGNGTVTSSYEILSDLGFTVLFVPFVAILANVSIAKAFSTGVTVDASQEMIALGLCNLFGSFVQSMPTCGAFSRSAVSQASGVRTPFAGFYSGTMTVLALSFLTPYFAFIPRATLGAVLICAVIFMVDFKICGTLWCTNRIEFWLWLSCFTVCMTLGVEIGLIFGMLSNAVVVFAQWARPPIKVTLRNLNGVDILYFFISLGVTYPGIDYLRQSMNKIGIQNKEVQVAVLDCSHISSLDYTAMKGLESITADYETRGQVVAFLHMPRSAQPLLETAKKVKVITDLKEILNFLSTQDSSIAIETKN